MKIEKNISVYMGDDPTRENRQLSLQQSGKEKKNGTFFAGSLNKNMDPIMQKKQMAQKRAAKIVSDAFAADRKLDSEIHDRESEIKRMTNENLEAQKAIRELDAQKEQIAKEYGDRELGEQELAEYNDRCAEIDELKKPHQNVITENTKTIKEYQQINKSIHHARLDLKNNPMVAASRQAEQIQESARKEIEGMLYAEGKDHLDEEMAERVEQAKEAREEKKEQEEKLEAVREKQEQIQEMVDASRRHSKESKERVEEMTDFLPIQELIQMDDIKTDVQQELKDILNKMKLIEEDIKGSAVDTVL